MDKQFKVNTLADAVSVMGSDQSKIIEAYGTARAKKDRAGVKVGDSLHAAGFLAAWCVSPYTAKDIDPEAIAGVFNGEEHTFGQVFDSVKLTLAHGYLSAKQFELYTMPQGKEAPKLPRSKAEERNVIVRQVGSLTRDVKVSLEKKEAAKALQDAQDAEDKLAKAEGREAETITSGEAGTSTRSDVVRIGEFATKAIKIAQAAETPDYDVNAVIKLGRDLLSVIGQTDTTLEA